MTATMVSRMECSEETFDGVAVRPCVKGRGVFATRDFQKGETVVVGKREGIVPERTVYSLQMEQDLHVQFDVPSRLINHSCGPNTGVRNNQYGGYDFVALEDIRQGDEITFDYETTEYISIAVPSCLCGSLACRGRIIGWHGLDENVRARYGEFIAGYLKRNDTHLQVCRCGDHACVFATRPIRAGEVLQYIITDRILAEPTYLTVQIDRHAHIDQIGSLAYMNHSCDPNVIFSTRDGVAVAARDIAPEEELTFFYPSTEWEMAQPFDCQCGASGCLGRIRGAKYLSREAAKRYYLNEHILGLTREADRAAQKAWAHDHFSIWGNQHEGLRPAAIL